MDQHHQAVESIATRVRHFHSQKTPFKIYHGHTNSTRKTSVHRDQIVDVSKLSHVLHVDTQSRTALVEPNVSMDRLIQETLRYGLIPLVVPEFPSITIGGGFAGTAGESSSFRHGFLDNTINWIEIVAPNGEVVTASSRERADLFHGVKGTFGTLGVTTLLEVRLLAAKPFVELTYHPIHSIKELIEKTQVATKDPLNDYVDALLYKRDHGVVITGRLTNHVRPGVKTKTFLRSRDEWYYLYVQDLLANITGRRVEAVPLVDYLFRYERGAFWTGRYAFTYFALPFVYILRWALDSLLHTKILYHGLHENGMAKDNIIQDIAVPISNALNLLHWLDENYGIYPLWLCPFRQATHVPMYPRMTGSGEGKRHSIVAIEQPRDTREASTAGGPAVDLGAALEDELLLSIGVWGPQLPEPKDFVAQNRKLEKKVRELHGMKWLYAHCYYTREEFWSIYNKTWYDDLRTKYNANYLPSVYDKTKFDWGAEERAIDASWLRWLFSFVWWIWPVPGIYGVICVFMQSEYLLSTVRANQ
ncbi:MAG: hypothetical protein Q9217_003316 [Psora testacea]